MNDQKTHWKRLENPNYIGVYAFNPGEQKIVTIKEITREVVHDEKGGEQEKSIAHFIENVKPMVLNKVNQKTIEKIYKTPYIEDWAGKKIQLFVTREKAFGEMEDVLRIRSYEPKQAPTQQAPAALTCSDCKQIIPDHEGAPARNIAASTNQKYGRPLCFDCAQKAKAAMDGTALATGAQIGLDGAGSAAQ